MNYGYPGGNTHLENHNVSEEGFWPSFTDIMMVIVMVFLLVTVAVILNNWTLISELKSSIEAQEVATSLADTRQEKNLNLESKLSQLEAKLLDLNAEYKAKKSNLTAAQEKLTGMEQQLTEKITALQSLDEKLLTLSEKFQLEKTNLDNTQKKLSEKELLLGRKESKLVALQTDLESTLKQKNELSQLSQTQKNKIDKGLSAQEILREQIKALEGLLTESKQDSDKNNKEIEKLKRIKLIKV